MTADHHTESALPWGRRQRLDAPDTVPVAPPPAEACTELGADYQRIPRDRSSAAIGVVLALAVLATIAMTAAIAWLRGV